MNGPLAYNKTGIIVVHAKASTVQYRLNRETENTKGIFKTIICRQSDNTLAKNQNDQKTTNSIQAAQHKKKLSNMNGEITGYPEVKADPPLHVNGYRKMWYECQGDNSPFKSQFVKVNHYRSFRVILTN